MRKFVQAAVLAASGHNAQPWKFLASDTTLEIYPDTTRRPPAVDPENRELWISLGCALENLSIAARHAGYEAEVTYPDGDNWIGIHFVPQKAGDSPLYSAISLRQNTRTEFDGSMVTDLTSALLNQPIEASRVRDQFRAGFNFGGANPQFLLRYGYAPPMPFSLRRPVEDVLTWSAGKA